MGNNYVRKALSVLPDGFSLVRPGELDDTYKSMVSGLLGDGKGRRVVCREYVPVGVIAGNAYHTLATAEAHDPERQVPRALRSNQVVSTVSTFGGCI